MTHISPLIYPAWQLAVTASGGNQAQPAQLFLETSNTLFKILLSEEESNDPDIPTADLFDLAPEDKTCTASRVSPRSYQTFQP